MKELYIDPATGDIELDGGEPTLTTGPETSLYLAISVQQGSFHGDPGLGSDLPAMTSGGTPPIDRDAEIERAVRDALFRLEDQGVIVVESVEVDGVDVVVHSRQLSTPYRVTVE